MSLNIRKEQDESCMRPVSLPAHGGALHFGLSGLQGSFSEEAAQKYAQRQHLDAEFHYLLDMEGVLRALNQDEIDLGIFPVVNSVGGLVQTAFEAMGKYPFQMVDKEILEVNQCLLVHPEFTDPKDLNQVASHPQALSQCQNHLDKNWPQLQKVEWSDTASAARDLARGILPKSSAVLAPKQSAQVYKLKVLEENVQDQHPNLTTFILVQKLPQ